MKAGVVTLWGLNNYGNRLQNYAVCSLLQKLGVDCETLVPAQWSKTDYRRSVETRVREQYLQDPLQAQRDYPQIVRDFRSKEFNEKYVPSRQLDSIHMDTKLAHEYDFFVVGGNRVWDPQFRDTLGLFANHLLSFAASSQRVCFAPSFGSHEPEAKWHDLLYSELRRYPYLNVQEPAGAEFIRQLTGRNAEVVLAPIFMVDREEWISLAKPLPGVETEVQYVLYDFPGVGAKDIPPEMKRLLDREVNAQGLKEYRFFDNDDAVTRSAGPSECLWLFQHASMVCTGSFYGAVLCILFGKPFLFCNKAPSSANDRTVSMLRWLGLANKLPDTGKLKTENIWENDYANAYRIIAQERERMSELLKTAMRLKQRQE